MQRNIYRTFVYDENREIKNKREKDLSTALEEDRVAAADADAGVLKVPGTP